MARDNLTKSERNERDRLRSIGINPDPSEYTNRRSASGSNEVR